MSHRPSNAESGGHGPRDLAAFNHWLNVSRVRAVAGISAFVVALQLLGIDQVRPLPVLLLCATLFTISVIALRATDERTQTSLTYFTLQTFLDLVAITVGLGVAMSSATSMLFRALYVMVIVPASLISVPIGLSVAAAASAAHALLLAVAHGGVDGMVVGPELLVPPFLFFLVAQQSFFYGGHIARKNRDLHALAARLAEHQESLQTEARTSAALAAVARTLGSDLDAPELLARVTRTALDYLGADWAATFVVDADARTFRLGAVSDPDIPASALGRIPLPLSSWRALERLAPGKVIRLQGLEAAQTPATFTGGTAPQSLLLTGLYREQAMIGLLAIGHDDGPAPDWASQLLAGIAEHAAVVLHNARLLEEVREASQLKSEFVGAVSHELRSPLNVILGYAEMLHDGGLGAVTADQARALDRTRRHALALLEMITALLDLNRLEAGRLPLQQEATTVTALLEELRDQLPESWRSPDVELRFVSPGDLPAIHTDRGKLKTVLRNLVHNALKFTTRGHVTVSAELSDVGELTFTVADSGCGIPPDALPYVFDMFRQVPGAGGGGVGLGLHIVRRFIDALGGRVHVVSEVGIGSRFRVILPLAVANADANAA
jgi:signal transduction histidine kinase